MTCQVSGKFTCRVFGTNSSEKVPGLIKSVTPNKPLREREVDGVLEVGLPRGAATPSSAAPAREVP